MTLVRTLSFDEPGFRQQLTELRDTLRSGSLTEAQSASNLDVSRVVAEILEKVRLGGDVVAARLTCDLDRASVTADTLRVPQSEIDAAHSSADPEFLALIRRAIDNIRAYQESILVKAPQPLARGGRSLGVRYTPMDRVCVYVPGGKALYPSTVLMTAVPARVAGVPNLVMVSPPTGGDIHPMALALAKELAIDEVYRLGGAVGLAAVAYGTETIQPVDKIVGPGNAFVAEAKRQLFGRVGIDAIAGPSEVLIVADSTARAEWVAADMLAQAEHDPGSAILVTPDRDLARAVGEQLELQLAALERRDATREALSRYGAILITRDLEAACDVANDFATEHLQIETARDDWCLERIRHAGAIFVGAYAPVPLGDYYAGPSHVLPTGGTAKFFGPLSCNEFLKSSSVIRYDAASLAEDAGSVIDFATREGLTAHAAAIAARSSSPQKRS